MLHSIRAQSLNNAIKRLVLGEFKRVEFHSHRHAHSQESNVPVQDLRLNFNTEKSGA
jgi:hypothetical protein